MKRRDFFKRIAVGGASVAAFSARDRAEAQRLAKNAPINEADLTWDKAPCRFCGTGCGLEVGVKDGKAVSVRGDLASPVSKGLLCVKGYHAPGLLYGEDRLLYPQRRKPSGELERIRWDDALDLIAGKYSTVLEKHGPNAVALYGSGQWTVHDGYAGLKWVKGGMRSNNIDPNARLCMASAVMGFVTTFQSDEPMGCYEDFEHGDDFVLWGNNMAEMHPVLFSRILERKRQKPDVRIIDLGTRWTPTTEFADMYLEFRPGSDLAIANAIIHVLIRDGKIQERFVQENVVFRRGIEDLETIGYGSYGEQAERYTFQDKPQESSFDELREFVAEYTPERAAEISGVPAGQIKALADMYGDPNRGTVSLWCMGVNQHYRGTWMNNLLNNLHLLTGKISRPGANPFSLTGQPSACGTAREVGTLSNRLPADMVVTKAEHRAKAEKIWGLPEGTINPTPGYHAVDMFRAFSRGDIKAMWVQVTNPWVTMPNLGRIEKMPPDPDRFLVVSDIYPTPSTDQADLILPAAAWIEREGVFGNSERRTQHWNKMVEPPGEGREDALQIIQVAKRMGYEHLFPWPEDAFHEPMYEEYRSFGLGTGKDLASYRELKGTRGMIWPVVDGRETPYRYSADWDPYVKKAKGVHFYKGKGYGEKAAVWLRPYHPPAEEPDEAYPMWLSTGRVLEQWHTGSMTRRIKQLHQATPEAYVEINRADATRLGIKDGDWVRVSSRRGQIELKAKIDGRGRPPQGSAFIPFFDETKLVNRVTLDAMDCISKQPDYKKSAVKVEKIDKPVS